ncbi:hypothetical protein BH10BAC2_BH10BAC2_04370 [soil metagenome]
MCILFLSSTTYPASAIKNNLLCKQRYIYVIQTIARMNYYKIVAFLLSVTLCTTTFAQDHHKDILDSFSAKYITAIRTQQKQRVYLVTDKSIYATGESIWLKAFLLNNVSQKINAKSRFLFVDLVNEKDSVIKVLILDAANKQLNTHIPLPDSLPAGNYWLRAYTRQMAEADINSINVTPLYIFDKTAGNNIVTAKKDNGKKDSIPAIIFYPEGGSIITGVNSTVALQVNDIDGTPMHISGVIKDNRDTIVASFTANQYGLAKFDFEPSGYRKYKAIITQNGKAISYPLPSFNFYTGQLSVTKEASMYKLRILLGDSIYRKDLVTYVIGISKDSLIFAGIGTGQYETPVTEKVFPEGIATFYLFDKSFNLLSERSIYVHDKNVHIMVATDKTVYSKRDKVILNISITDAAPSPVPSLFAIAVTDTLFSNPSAQYNDNEHGIIDNLSLVHNEALTDLDAELKMLTRHTTYRKPGEANFSSTAVDMDSLLYIRGTLFNEKKVPSSNKSLTLISSSGNLQMYTDTTDAAGRFCFRPGHYADSTEFIIEIRDAKGNKQNDSIALDKPAYLQVSTPVGLKQFLPATSRMQKKYLQAYYNTSTMDFGKETLPHITVKDNKKKVDYSEAKRVSPNSSILSSGDLTERTSVGNSILRVSGMHLLQGYLVINGLTAMKAPNALSEPLLLVDGAPVSVVAGLDEVSPVISYLNSLNPKDIDFIEILKGPEGANYGVRGGNGVILVNMLSRRRELDPGKNNLKIFYAKGISMPGLFPTTDYLQKETKTTTDNRSTLFWNGSYLTGDTQNATLIFYTSDIPATYKVIITGITINGDLIYKTITFQSK